MTKGRLRVLLGAAPGVGTTSTMLEEGGRLAAEGRDVVIAVVETHGRAETAARIAGLEVVPRRTVLHRGARLEEMDPAAVLARRPDIALVDELAHTNAPGTRHRKRWEDVAELLDAGITVLTTVDIQHIASLSDVVEAITGARPHETIPDAVLRAADRIELVDLAPQALRDRLAAGRVFPPERIDAELSHRFRLGTLTALRELALLWLADEVDSALRDYRGEHGIDSTWAARERVVVTLTGGSEGETLLRRGARIAARASGGDLLAVHVLTPDGLRTPRPEVLAAQRALVESLGGSYHQVVGEDVPRTLVAFARSVDATQLVLGVSRRSRLAAALTPGIGATVIRESGDIDVHIVSHSAAGRAAVLPRLGGALTLRRRLLGTALALVGGPLVTWLMASLRSDESITSDVLSYQLLVVLVALVGGLWPALFAAVLSGLTLDYFFVDPLYTVSVDEPLHELALALYVLNAVLVSAVVDRAARRSRAAKRSGAEAELLATIAGGVIRGQGALQAILERAREAFGLTGVRLVRDGTVVAADGEPTAAGEPARIPVGAQAELELHGRELEGSERRLLQVVAAQLDSALEREALSETASSLAPLAETDRMRSALLSAVSHDLRRPLAAATAAVSGLRSRDVEWSEGDRAELLATADESLTTLGALVTDLLDVTRLEAGVLAVSLAPLDAADVVLPALDELGLGPGEVDLDLDPDGPELLADGVLLQRVVVNLLANAVRYAPEGTRVRVSTSVFGGTAQIRIVDHGPGIAPERREEVFVPFQRLGDDDNTTGLGLGLALSKGFTEGMGGTLEAEDTPGGGLTMVVTLPVVADDAAARTDAAETDAAQTDAAEPRAAGADASGGAA
ncbi:two-component system sensor histidine kinase KdpD [Rathayibacter sp. PhB93]|uniref:ATP-binding protein n=1 Tax=unclassified Rathayibacter TaxID=2609250 RepID=UPI000F48A9C6|nr:MULTISPECIES: ATP-binding protein [unclassified Rathayibacter]ROQ03544.1 two-component system sensor histidine kinase KdpD [Rathayibacter sp. PhB93]TDQ10569.1 two-component system sensor histidine kinase KdpD [Rathayibacter sp. PhB1]